MTRFYSFLQKRFYTTDADGGLTITIQHAEPDDPAQRANWLPAPAEEFYISLRLYWPKPAALDGTWEPPLIVRVDER